jgi:hypothetical protein
MIGAEGSLPNVAAAKFSPPSAGPGAEPLAVIAPAGIAGLSAFVCTMFYDMGTKNGFKNAYNHVLTETYDSMRQVGVPFQIGDMCSRAGVTRALVVGPGPDSPLFPRANEFGHAVRRILESSGIQIGWIPCNGLQIGAHYLNAHLDFEK